MIRNSTSQWTKFLAQPGHIRAVALEASDLVRELCVQQGTVGLGQIGYAEAVMGTLLIASGHKSNESINMNARGSSIFRQALVDATPDGRVRGFLSEDSAPNTGVVQGPWGTGVLSILYTKNSEGKTPYTGMVAIATGYLDEAINDYYRDSEQLVSIVGLHVVRQDGVVREARGALIQAVGGASEEELNAIQALSVQQMRELAAASDKPDLFKDKLAQIFAARTFTSVEQLPLRSFCTCSLDRIERALVLTGEADTIEALADDPVMTVTCDFCRREYKIAAERVRSLFAQDPSRLQ